MAARQFPPPAVKDPVDVNGKTLHEIQMRGISVFFPHNPYPQQVEYMEKVVQALQESKHALLESPTGTGKTLSLLCASIAWLQVAQARERATVMAGDVAEGTLEELVAAAGPAMPTDGFGVQRQRVVYLSRTHTQLTQVVRELRATGYTPKTAILGSREQMCIHPEVKTLRGTAQNGACNKLVGAKACPYYQTVKEEKRRRPEVATALMDIEDLVTHGTTHKVCPYFLSRELQSEADLTLMPYNYLTDGMIRRSMQTTWTDACVIFDEAHNLESTCADAASFNLSTRDVALAVAEVSRCLAVAGGSIDDLLQANTAKCSPEELAMLKALLLKLEAAIDALDLPPGGTSKPGGFLHSLLNDCGINDSNIELLVSMLDRASAMLTEARAATDTGAAPKAPTLSTLSSGLQLVFAANKDVDDTYRVYLFQEQESQSRSSAPDFASVRAAKQAARVVGFWCFSPGVTMQAIIDAKVRSVLLTSGTLSPMDGWESEMRIPFPVRLENTHVVGNTQVWAGVVAKGPSGKVLNASFRNRDSSEYKAELGNLLVNVCRVVPDGVLVFFPSYVVMSRCVEHWKASRVTGGGVGQKTMWERLERLKAIFVEARTPSEFLASVKGFQETVDKGTTGAVFLAVCRGKLSEGIDFADRHGRAVVVTGLPFPAHTEPKVILKRDFLDEVSRKTPKNGVKGITGEQWYIQHAARAVNQAIGRVIRHRHDHGAIILADERFEGWLKQKTLSRWLRPFARSYTFGETVASLTRFFKAHNAAPQTHPSEGPSASAGKHSLDGGGIVRILPRAPISAGQDRGGAKEVPVVSAEAVTSMCSALVDEETLAKQRLSAGPRRGTSMVEAFSSSQTDPQPAPAAAPHPKPGTSLSLAAQLAAQRGEATTKSMPFRRPLTVPTIRKKDGQDNAANLLRFLEMLKRELDPATLAHFKGLMKEFKSRPRSDESFDSLFRSCNQLFVGPNKLRHLEALISFFPSQKRQKFTERLREAQDGEARSADDTRKHPPPGPERPDSKRFRLT